MNIVLIMADQMAPAALPFYGHPLVKAPNMAKLAEEGVVFDAAYCNSPLCSPSRAAFMSGSLPSRTGAYDNASEFRSDIPTFAHYLRGAGYRTILSGKMHFCGPDQLHGFEERLTTDIYPADFGWTPDWDHPHDRPSWYHNMSSVTDAGLCVRTNQLDFDDEVIFASERAIYDHVRSADKRPFCMVVSLTHPHDPFAIPEKYWNLYKDEEIDLPAVGPGDVPRTPHEERLSRVCDMDGAEITEQDIRNARRAYYGAISYVDDNVGRIMQTLKAAGLDENTVVIVTSDHGEMLGERGFWYKMSFFEGASRVPLLVHAPAAFPAHRVSRSVSLVDVLPTLVEIASGQGETPYVSEIDGRSLLPHLLDNGGHDEVIGEYLAEGAVAPIIMIRRGDLKFVHSPADPDQLYDLASDPRELVNLAGSPEHAGTVARFRAEIEARWDLQALDEKVRDSQRRRQLVTSALSQGAHAPWDYQPVRDASRQYIRNHMDLDDLEAKARFPRVAGPSGHTNTPILERGVKP
ncbi:choline-sulfatase [Faunimonas pinastri]|uniref:Choline-sulfatase n=1 Tax=Faunimonas pinastri TaxID=1855383 RepID=A0A1H9HXZ2_9HYPH|nr:choline-sulfatase [Faunimonas pinastri]SEQ67127.1 choline-sulfatase [Faunimonas pinastri]